MRQGSAKGSVLLHFREYVKRFHGPEQLRELELALTPESRAVFSGLMIHGGWYPVSTWNEALGTWNKSGRSASEPMLIGAYGGGDERPLLKTGTSNGFDLNGKRADHLAIQGIHLYSQSRDPYSSSFSSTSSNYGIRFIGSGTGLLIEDVVVDNYGSNISLGSWDGNPSDVTVLRMLSRLTIASVSTAT